MIDPTEYRKVLGHYATGVAVVTAVNAEPVGMAVNSFTSVSLDPPLVSFCAAVTSTTWPRIRAAGRFAVNVLGDHQQDACRRFASKDEDRFASTPWHRSTGGCPILDDALAWLDCEIAFEHLAGDHVIVGGRVVALDAREGDPLLFCRGRYGVFRSLGDPLR